MSEEFGGQCQTCKAGYVVGGRCVVCGAAYRPPPKEGEEPTEADLTMQLLATLLTRTAQGLKGDPPELAPWSWHDLPDIAARLRAFAEGVADEGCEHGDNCKDRTPPCLPCRARRAMYDPEDTDARATT